MIVGGLSLCIPVKNQKVYSLFWHACLFMFSKKHYSPKESSLLIPYKSFENNGIIALKSGSYAKVFELTGFNIFILQDQEAQIRLESFRNVARASGYSFSIIKQNLPSSLEEQMLMIEKQIELTEDSKLRQALEDNLGALKSLEEKELNYVDKFFLIIYGSMSTIDKFQLQVKNALEGAYLFPIEASIKVCKMVINNFYEIGGDEFNMQLPTKTSFESNHMILNNKYVKVYALTQFPRFAYLGWLQFLNLGPQYSYNIKVEVFDKAKASNKINRVIRSIETARIGAKKASEKTQGDTYLDGLQELNDLLHADGETINSTYSFIKVSAGSKNELDELCSRLVSELKGANIQFDTMKNLQKEGLGSILPKASLLTRKLVSLEMPSIALACGFPFHSEVHKDEGGNYLGYTNSGNNVFFNPWIRNSMRQNSNIIILGTSGAGKSTTSKKLIKDQVIFGTKVFAIDPEREYKKLCESLNGSWVNFGTDHLVNSKSEIVINPLQFLKNETGERSILASHIQFLEEFFRTLFPSIDLAEMSILRRCLIKLYTKWKINSLNSHLTTNPKDFPILGDLVALMRDELSKIRDIFDQDIIKQLLIYLEVFEGESPEGQLWNAHTNFDIHAANFVVMDIHSLTESGNKRLANAQMFLLLKIINNAMVQNKIRKDAGKENQKMMIVIDEAHLLVDESQPASLDFMYQMVKRARKYDALTMITTQNIKDFVGGSAEIQKKTQAIINTSQYSFLLRMNPGDIEDLNKVYSSTGGLTEQEKQTLSMAGRGKAIMALSAKDRKIIQVDILDEEMALWE